MPNIELSFANACPHASKTTPLTLTKSPFLTSVDHRAFNSTQFRFRTEDAGGFLYATAHTEQRLGFDIESLERVRPAIVKRVLSPGEAFDESRIAQHWCAKEAVVKALAHSTGLLPLITEIHISWLDDSRFVANGAWGFAVAIGDFGFSAVR